MSATVFSPIKHPGQSFGAVLYFWARSRIFWPLLIAFAFLLCQADAAESARFVPNRILLKPKASLPDTEFDRRLNRHGVAHSRILRHSNVRVVTVSENQTADFLAAMAKDPDIEFAERDYIATASFIPNDPYLTAGNEWHLSRIQAPEAWDSGVGSSNIIVAVLDSGVNAAHPDLAGRLLPGYDFVWGDNDPADDFGHGTAVAGTIVASGNNGIGVAGVAFGCSVLPVKVMDASGSASHSTLAQGIEYAVTHGARIINLSLGGDWPSSTLQDAINFAWSNNVVVVAAAGNGGGTTPQYPAACDHVVAVSATDTDDSRAYFSSYGSFVTLSAPGTAIWTTQRDLSNPYGPWSGTSFACPIAAGVAALVASANPSLSNTQIVDVLKQTADDLGSPGYDTSFGYGRVNASRAVALVGAGVVRPVLPVVAMISPIDGVQFPLGTAVSLSAMASVSTGAITAVTFFANGLALGNLSLAPFALDWTPLQPGPYTLSAVAMDDAGTQVTSAPVIVHISSPEATVPLVSLVVTASLTLQTNGVGTVHPDLNGRLLEVGKTYTVKAVPGPGQVFAGWQGSSAMAPVLSFVMQTNLTLVARFIPNPFPAVRGNYAGLMANTNGVTPANSGYFNLTVSASGVFTGKLLLAGNRHSFRGRLDLAGNAVLTVRRSTSSPLTLTVHVDLARATDQAVGYLSDGFWTSTLAGDRNVFDSRINPASQAGLRAFVLERAADNTSAASGSSKISASGSTQVRGALSDGRRFSTGSILARNGDCPFYLSLNRGAEVVIGWLNFPAGQGPVASGTVLWVKTGTNSFADTLRATSAPGQ